MTSPRPAILSPALVRVFLATFGTTTSFYLLLSVVPLYATSIGAGDIGAGLATGALMFATVAAELVTPALLARLGYQVILACGLVLLGAPALAMPASTSLAAILALCVVRGLGFAVLVVVGSALVGSLVPPERRGEGLGIYGIVVGVPSVVALPLGVWLVGRVGYPPVFVAGALAALLSLLAVPGLPGRSTVRESPLGVPTALRMPALLRPALVFASSAMAGGVVVTFLPLALNGPTLGLAEIALLIQSLAMTVSRWWAGGHGDRHGAGTLLLPSLVASALGILALALTTNPVAVLGGMLVFGLGFGVAQNASLALMFDRVPSSDYGTVSAVWNLAYDAGLGVGAVVFGVLAASTGYPLAFALTAAVMLAAIVPALRDRRASS